MLKKNSVVLINKENMMIDDSGKGDDDIGDNNGNGCC